MSSFSTDEHSTLSILLTRFDHEKVIRLEDICDRYFGLNYESAKRRAKVSALPVATFRIGSSQKQPLLINISDLAHHIDKITAKATDEWIKFQ